MMKKTLLTICAAWCFAVCQAETPSQLLHDPTVAAALEAVERNEPEMITEQIRVCEIPAPSFKEQVRGEELKRLFEKLGLRNVYIDKSGNVLGTRRRATAQPGICGSFGYGVSGRHQRQGHAGRNPAQGARDRRRLPGTGCPFGRHPCPE